MEKRWTYKPLFRINKSVLFLGLTWEDMLPGLFIFLIFQIATKDLMICSFLSLFFVAISVTSRRKHRSKILKDLALQILTEDVIYVDRNGCFKLHLRKK